VYSGLDVGFAVAAPVFGALMDRGVTLGIFGGAAVALLMGIASAGLVGLGLSRRSAAPVPA
jgi:hypothetical protein